VTHDDNRAWMERAITVGRKARYWSAPNPPVGCVLLRDGAVIGEGFTQPVGNAHAEIMALQAARDLHGPEGVAGATAFVTLEPCSHEGRTGPCVEALIEARIKRVVVAIEDPNPAVSGQGLSALRDAGIAVELGICAEQVEQDLAGFLLRMRRGYGRITLKLATSLDGRTAMASGESQWVTGSSARQDVQRLRAEADVIVTGIGTVLADDCRLTLRADALPLSDGDKARALAHAPARMVLDSRARTPLTARILEGESTTIVTTVTTQPGDLGAETKICQLPADAEGRVALTAWVDVLRQRAYNEILVEAGPTLAGAMLKEGWVDQLVVYQAPKLLGDAARPMAIMAVDALAEAIELNITEVTRLDTDLRIIATPHA
jgi:diaminohydroxyphosphoribosylaminopyrimidine deaminase/5-amino-6-(5-phosphoribosylamino)uracil reductase